MPRVNVKTKPGRVAFTAMRGERIPNDRYVPVELTPWIQRLLEVHGDIEREREREPAAPAAKPEGKS